MSWIPQELLKKNKKTEEDLSELEEHKALFVLQHWEQMLGFGSKLVPEHVEIRSLLNSEKPGLAQVSTAPGLFHSICSFLTPLALLFWFFAMNFRDVFFPFFFKGYVHMWIDMFPVDVPAPPPVNIKPRLPIR